MGKKFNEGYNGKTFEKWTEERVHEIIDRMYIWMDGYEEIEVYNPKTKKTEKQKGRANLFFTKFLRQEGLYTDWLCYVKEKFESVSDRMEILEKIQAERLSELALHGETKENFTKFLLMANHGYTERMTTENTNKNEQIIWNETKNYERE